MRQRRCADAGGFTYLGLLIAIAMLGIALSTVGVVWSTQIRRDKEVELLYAGGQIRTAIGRYRASGGTYPLALSDLLDDKRSPVPRRYLRRLYLDPLTSSGEWQLILAPRGGILGVASGSQLKPIKVAGFPAADAAFEKAECYCDWKFIDQPKFGRRQRVTAPIARP